MSSILLNALASLIVTAAPNPMVQASADAKRLQTFQVQGLKSRVTGTIYPSEGVQQGGVPLGGLGTGYLCLDPDGRLGKCSIFNRLPAP